MRGLRSPIEIRAVCGAVLRPVDVLVRPELSLAEIAEAGARRVSVGRSLTWVAVNALAAAACELRDRGDFSSLAPSPPRLVLRKAWSTLVHRTLEAKLADLLTDWSTEHQQRLVAALNQIADTINRAALKLRTTQLSWRSV